MTKEISNKERRALWEQSLIYDKTLDGNGLGKMWHPEGTFQIGSMPEVKGNENIAGFFKHFFSMGLFKSLEHEMVEVWDLPEALIYNGIAIYNRPDGSVLRTPYVNVLKYKEGKFWSYNVFIDTKPLMS
ncbi:hypothetical protein BH09BAC3_BH09BAC3_37380 [soil metagenome]